MSDFGGFWRHFWAKTTKKASKIGKKDPDIECQGLCVFFHCCSARIVIQKHSSDYANNDQATPCFMSYYVLRSVMRPRIDP